MTTKSFNTARKSVIVFQTLTSRVIDFRSKSRPKFCCQSRSSWNMQFHLSFDYCESFALKVWWESRILKNSRKFTMMSLWISTNIVNYSHSEFDENPEYWENTENSRWWACEFWRLLSIIRIQSLMRIQNIEKFQINHDDEPVILTNIVIS